VPKITRVRTIRTRRNGGWLIVKVETDQPGLYGVGSASDWYHGDAVQAAIEQGLGPRLIGREAARIEDNWQSGFTSGYWRNGAILNTALGGIDVALWDIKGKEAGLPLRQLLGGACRAAVPCYAHASGDTLDELEQDVRRYGTTAPSSVPSDRPSASSLRPARRCSASTARPARTPRGSWRPRRTTSSGPCSTATTHSSSPAATPTCSSSAATARLVSSTPARSAFPGSVVPAIRSASTCPTPSTVCSITPTAT
jgi:hypothetical protein